MEIRKELRNFIVLLCVLAVMTAGIHTQIHKTLEYFSVSQSVSSAPLICQSLTDNSILWHEQKVTRGLAITLESALYQVKHSADFFRSFFLFSFIFPAIFSEISKQFTKGVYTSGFCHIYGLRYILAFIQNMDGQK